MKGMSNISKQRLILSFIAVLLCSFLISAVSGRGGVFIIEPMQEVIENVELGVSDKVSGNLSVNNGFIDFYITTPSGEVLLSYNKTTFDTFSFVAHENGTFTMHLVNKHRAENVNVTLNYAVHFTIFLQGEVNVGYNVGTATVISTPPPVEHPDPEINDLTRKYLNFLKAHEILRIVRGVRKYVPLQLSFLVLGCIALATALIEIVKLVHRSSFPASLMS